MSSGRVLRLFFGFFARLGLDRFRWSGAGPGVPSGIPQHLYLHHVSTARVDVDLERGAGGSGGGWQCSGPRERGCCWQQVRCCQGWGSCLESNESKIPRQPHSARVSVAETSATREVPWAQRSAQGQGRASAGEGFAVALSSLWLGGEGPDPWGWREKGSKCLLLCLALWKHPKTRGVSSQAQPGLPP